MKKFLMCGEHVARTGKGHQAYGTEKTAAAIDTTTAGADTELQLLQTPRRT